MVYLKLVNHDEIFASLTTHYIMANDIDVSTSDGRANLNRLLYNKYEGDSLNILPSCSCGDLQGGYNVGVQCVNCGTMVVPTMERPLESMIWFRAPDGVRALINPTAWVVLSTRMTINGFNLLEWLCNPAYKPPGKVPPKLSRLERYNFPRGINGFYENFDTIMDAVFALKLVKEQGPQLKDVRHWIAQNRNSIFSQHLPMPSKLGFVVESATTVSYVDKTIVLAIDALKTIVSIENSIAPLPLFRKQVRTIKAITKLAEYYRVFVNKTLGGKPGIFRRHVFGGRLHFSARAVISSLSANHRYDELHLPWSLALQLLRLHLTGKLLRRIDPNTGVRYSPVSIDQLFRESALQYNPLLDTLLKELISESPHGGIPVTFGRNPTLARGSIQVLYVTHIKTDPEIITISLSVLVLRGFNADFDGDEMNLWLIPDHATHRRLSRLAPHLTALDLNEPRRISGNLALPAPAVSTIANWMYHPETCNFTD